MKTIIITILTVFVASFANGQGIMAKWPQLKTFHGVMSQTFHPSEEGNLEPIKKRSGEMVEKADLLAKSTIPAEFNSKEVVAAVKKLETDSKKLNKLVKNNKSDKEITEALSKLHDVFMKLLDYVVMKTIINK